MSRPGIKLTPGEGKMKKEFVTYSEAFKMQVVKEISQGKFASILQAQKTYGICGMNTIQKWIGKYFMLSLEIENELLCAMPLFIILQ
jgi:transposase-like protein